MKKKKYLYLRALKKVDFSVFCVDSEQKTYYDKEFGQYVPYSSGQQVKRCVVDSILDGLDLIGSPITFNFEVDGTKLKQKEITQPCDPTYLDQLIAGWMSNPDKTNGDDGTDKDGYGRRSPLSISAMTALHPLLATTIVEKAITFDRTDGNSERMVVRSNKGNVLNSDEVEKFLETCNSKLTKRKAVVHPNMTTFPKRANGLFRSDMVIDLSRLFRVPVLINDREISDETEQKLLNAGWVEVEKTSGKWLELPKEMHEEVAEAIAWAMVDWRITSNQARTFDLMPTLSIAISDNANEIANAMRGDLIEKDGKEIARLVVDNNYPNTKIFSTNLLKGHILDAVTSYTAIDDAVAEIKNKILEYYK